MTTRDEGLRKMIDAVNLNDRAGKLGGHAADSFRDEFGEQPTRQNVGDWDEAAWSVACQELKNAGMTDADYDLCLDEWRDGFFGENTTA